MTVFTTDNKIFADGNGVTASFDFPFKYFNADEISLYVDDVLADSSDYTLTRNPSGDGGTIVPDVAPPTGIENVLIYRALDFTQETRVPTVDKIARGTLENAYDKLTMLTQQLAEQLSRALVLPLTFPAGVQMNVPEPEAGRALIWNENLDGLVNSDANLETLLADCTAQAVAAAASAAASLASQNAAAGSVSLASGYATTAGTNRDNAFKWASNPEDVLVNDGVRSGYSAYHWSRKTQSISIPLANKGELFGRGASGNEAVPAPTANGQVLVADDTKTSGLAWGDGTFTGAVMAAMRNEALTPSGWILATGTIGNAASGGSRRANADCANLFTVLWTSFANAQAPVSGGRGVSAAADFAANKTITIPDLRGATIVGKDNMGGTSANQITAQVPNSANAVILGGKFGEAAHAQSATELRSHGHSLGTAFTGAAGAARNVLTSLIADTVLDGGVNPDAMNVVQPSIALNIFVKL